MKDANYLRKLVSIASNSNEIVFEKSADILFDACSSVIKNHKIVEGTKEICIAFRKIDENLTQFTDANLYFTNKDSTKTIETIAEESINLPNYASYLPLKFAIDNCNKLPFSGLKRNKQDYENFILLRDVLNKRGLYCCVRCGWNELYFAVVLPL